MQNRTRAQQLIIRVTPQEKAMIQIKMKQMGTNSFSRYARKMLIDGWVIHLDMKEFNELATEVRKIGNNINQITKLANENGSVYSNEIKKVAELMVEIWRLLRSSQSTLQSISR